jgi:hypothetical protein
MSLISYPLLNFLKQVLSSSKALLSLCYGMQMPKPPLPQLYFDEHIKQVVVDTFKEQGFKGLLISNTRKYAERDEKDYIQEIYAEGRVFVTSDVEFFYYLLDNKVKHAGVVLIPPGLTDDENQLGAFELAGLLKGYIDSGGKHALRRLIFYIAADGFRVVDDAGKDQLLYSWEALERDYDITD